MTFFIDNTAARTIFAHISDGIGGNSPTLKYNDMKIHGKIIAYASLAVFCAAGCGNGERLTREERELIFSGSGKVPMRVLTVDNREDSLVLRTPCKYFNADEITELFSAGSETSPIGRLGDRMISTVTAPSQDGVGIAGPQVGISRRIVAVQRFDKPGEPFEVYPNIRIIRKRGQLKTGPEGCLSIPGRRGCVERYDTVEIRYARIVPFNAFPGLLSVTPEAEELSKRFKGSKWEYVTETVGGFTAVIFQHECDHLDGILYTDRQIPQPEM